MIWGLFAWLALVVFVILFVAGADKSDKDHSTLQENAHD